MINDVLDVSVWDCLLEFAWSAMWWWWIPFWEVEVRIPHEYCYSFLVLSFFAFLVWNVQHDSHSIGSLRLLQADCDLSHLSIYVGLRQGMAGLLFWKNQLKAGYVPQYIAVPLWYFVCTPTYGQPKEPKLKNQPIQNQLCRWRWLLGAWKVPPPFCSLVSPQVWWKHSKHYELSSDPVSLRKRFCSHLAIETEVAHIVFEQWGGYIASSSSTRQDTWRLLQASRKAITWKKSFGSYEDSCCSRYVSKCHFYTLICETIKLERKFDGISVKLSQAGLAFLIDHSGKLHTPALASIADLTVNKEAT